MIKTFKENNTITKVRIENASDLFSFMYSSLGSVYSFLNKEDQVIVTLGKSTPRNGDEFNEKSGNIIAFRKARIKANKKKIDLLIKFRKFLLELIRNTNEKTLKLQKFVDKDVRYIKENFNSDFQVY